MKRAVNRARQRGLGDMLAYSFSVVQNAAMNRYLDLRYGGKVATNRHTEFEESIPGTQQIFHTDYKFLENIFERVHVSPSDVLVDVGCGDGRVIAYWLNRGFKNKIVGIELDPETASDTAKRFARFKNVQILQGDVADLAPGTKGTLFYLFNPFVGEPLQRFAEAVKPMNAKVVLYSYNELQQFAEWRVDKFLEPGQDPAYRFAIISPQT